MSNQETHTISFEQSNREYFDKMANSYDSKPWQKAMSDYITEQLRKNMEWVDSGYASTDAASKNTRLLDYACGTGLVSRALGPYVSSIRGIDLSPAMVERFNALASEAGLPQSQIHAVVGNLLNDDPNEAIEGSDYHDFDIAAIGMGFHHIEHRIEMLKRIAKLLKPGGILLLVDFLVGKGIEDDDDDVHHWHAPAKPTISVAGFTEQGMKEVYEEAGFGGFGLQVFPEKVMMAYGGVERHRTVFLAKGKKL